MAVTATIAGGGEVKLRVNLSEVQAAKDALATLSENFTSGVIMTSTAAGIPLPLDPNRMDVYNIPGGEAFVAPAGTDAVVISNYDPSNDTNIFLQSSNKANPETQLIIGAQSNDTLTFKGAGSVIGGGGSDTVDATSRGSGDVFVRTGNGQDSITFFGQGTVTSGGGNDTVVFQGTQAVPGTGEVDAGAGNDQVRVQGDVTVDAGAGSDVVRVSSGSNAYVDVGTGSDTVYVADANATIVNHLGGHTRIQIGGTSENVLFQGTGTDKIFLGGGNDTIIEAGTATVIGGTGHSTVSGGDGNFRFKGLSGVDSVTAGSGSATMVAGTGNTVFTAATGDASMQGGAGDVTMVGGSGNETMIAGTKSSLFSFDSAHAGGTTIIRGFEDSTVPGVKSTQLEFTGYNVNDIVANATVSGGSTFINLGDGTQIILKNFKTFGIDDIKQ